MFSGKYNSPPPAGFEMASVKVGPAVQV